MSQMLEVKVPDLGEFEDVPVIEVMVKAGDAIKAEDPLITIESEKATIDVPSPAPGTVKDVKLKVGDKVSQGSLVLLLEVSDAVTVAPAPATAPTSVFTSSRGPAMPPPPPPPSAASVPASVPAAVVPAAVGHRAHASPSVRRFARELGADVVRVKGSGPKGRILKEDVQAYVKGVLTGAAPAAGGGALDLLPWPKVDFAKFGPIELKPRSRIKKISGPILARNWAMIPHVTQFDEADITELEKLRVSMNKKQKKDGAKITALAFLIKASVESLREFPDFNSSLDGDNLVLKRYFHIGFAADTPNGLVVPVVKDADKKSVVEIAGETAALAKKAREGKLAPTEMQGGCFSISSLGGIGGSAFTPIINAPEVAVLGVSKSETRPRWNGKKFVPRLMLPLSLSYDHRVIDGALAARFIVHLGQVLADMHRRMKKGK